MKIKITKGHNTKKDKHGQYLYLWKSCNHHREDIQDNLLGVLFVKLTSKPKLFLKTKSNK
jgi:hypothetical protein